MKLAAEGDRERIVRDLVEEEEGDSDSQQGRNHRPPALELPLHGQANKMTQIGQNLLRMSPALLRKSRLLVI